MSFRMGRINFRRFRWVRGALKCRNSARDIGNHSVDASAHFLQESRTGSLSALFLTTGPTAVFSLHRPAEDSQDRGRHRVAHPAAVLSSAHVQAIMKTVLNAPILAHQVDRK